MKTHKDVVKAQLQFFKKRDLFLKINAVFFRNLINQLYEKGEIPQGDLIKYQAGTNDNINIAEELLNLENDGTCTVRIAIIVNQISQSINFRTMKQNDFLILDIQIEEFTKKFKYDVSTEFITETIDFSDAVNFIFETIEGLYKRWNF